MSELMTPKGELSPASAPTLGSAGARRAGRGLWDRVKAAARAFLNRRSVYRLAELDDRTLKDIGLLRTDVDSALSLPLYQDPTTLLAERAHHRRAQARATARLMRAREEAERDGQDGNAQDGNAQDKAQDRWRTPAGCRPVDRPRPQVRKGRRADKLAVPAPSVCACG